MGFLDWIRRRNSGDKTTITVTSRTVSSHAGRSHMDRGGAVEAHNANDAPGAVDLGNAVELLGPQGQAAINQIDHLAHEMLAAGGGGVFVTSSSSVVVDGQVVSPDDPRAREAMAKAAAKLRAQGFDELADDLERQSASAPSSSAAPTPSAAPPPHAFATTSAHAQLTSGDARNATVNDAQSATSNAATDVAADAAADVIGDDIGEAPSAPTPPDPPSPPA